MLVCTNLEVAYDSKLAIHGVNIELDFPSIVALLGNNGAGKSTFLNTLRGKINFLGSISLNSEEYNPLDFTFLGQSYQFNFSYNVADFIRIQQQDNGDTCFEWLLAELKLEELVQKNIMQLSQGQLQKCLLAQTLMQNTPIVLLDEPETSLDLKNRALLAKVLVLYAQKYRKIIIFASHDLQLVANCADYLLNFSNEIPVLELYSEENLVNNIRVLSE